MDVVSFMPHRFTLKERSPGYPLNKRLRGLHGRSGRAGEEKKLVSATSQDMISPRRPLRSPATVPTETLLLLLLLLLLLTAIELSFGGSSPYTSTSKTNKNIHK